MIYSLWVHIVKLAKAQDGILIDSNLFCSGYVSIITAEFHRARILPVVYYLSHCCGRATHRAIVRAGLNHRAVFVIWFKLMPFGFQPWAPCLGGWKLLDELLFPAQITPPETVIDVFHFPGCYCKNLEPVFHIAPGNMKQSVVRRIFRWESPLRRISDHRADICVWSDKDKTLRA